MEEDLVMDGQTVLIGGGQSNLALVLIKEKERRVMETVKHIINFTDADNAEGFVKLYGKEVRFCPQFGKWFIWDDTRWAEDQKNFIRSLILHAIQQTEGAIKILERTDPTLAPNAKKGVRAIKSLARIKALEELAKANQDIVISPNEMDKEPMLFNVLNGTIDLSSGELRSHSREDLITKIAPVEYDPEARAERWERFLNLILNGKQELIKYIRKILGYSLTGDISEQALFFFHGDGGNGKTTLLKVFLEMLGDYGKAGASNTLIAKKFDTHPTEIGYLQGSRFALFQEAEAGRYLSEVTVKQMTGGDRITARKLYKDFYEFDSTFKIFFSVNHMPKIRGTDKGIRRRIKRIPFDVTIPESQRDMNFISKLREELPGILNWAIQGCLEWQSERLGEPEEVQSATREYLRQAESIGRFISERCTVGESETNFAWQLYEAYTQFCKAEGLDRISQKDFGPGLEANGFTKGEQTSGPFKGRVIYRGLKLRME